MINTFKTSIGTFKYNDKEYCNEFLGIPYATAKRFEYPELVNSYDNFDATSFGDGCPQKREFYQHLEIPERKFYYREFRDGLSFNYSENCLVLNIYSPKEKGNYPVLVYIHGGGFDSGTISESYVDGAEYAKRGVVCVCIEYRVGVFGYLTHEDIFNKYGHDGNFGLYDQLTSLIWINKYINNFYGDQNNVTLIGQSAGAISIQYLCLSNKADKYFNRAIMMSGGGCFPKFSLPRYYKDTREYWLDLFKYAKVNNFDEFKQLSDKEIFDALELIKQNRKDNTYNTMPVIDDDLIVDHIDKLIKHPLKKDYMIGYTNCDMFAGIMAYIGHKFANHNKGYVYYFDCDAPGTNNQAFHSADLRYVLGTLKSSFRPYTSKDYEISNMMIDYIANFCKNGNPNSDNLPKWSNKKNKCLCINYKKIKMGKPNTFKLIKNTFAGDPK